MSQFSATTLHTLRLIGIDHYEPRSAKSDAAGAVPSVASPTSPLNEATINPAGPLMPKPAMPPPPKPQTQPIAPKTHHTKRPTVSPVASTKEVEPIGQAEPTSADIEGLHAQIKSCEACGLCRDRKQAVVGVGAKNPDWFIVGEAPGAEEDEVGEPFVGMSGKLLTTILSYFAIERHAQPKSKQSANAFITNAIKCRPPDNRPPTLDEIGKCMPFLHQQIALLKPKIIIAVGRSASIALLKDDKTPIGKLRERVHHINIDDRDIPLVATYHPSYLLRNLPEKRKAWDDLMLARSVFDTLRTTP